MSDREEAMARIRKSNPGFKEDSIQEDMNRRAREVKERQLRDGKGPQYVASPDVSLPVVPSEPRLHQKYKVLNKNGERLLNCFVLRPDKDKVALAMLRLYANSPDCPPSLAADIASWIDREKFKPTGTAD